METVVIAGRTFQPVTNSTMRHDIWTQAQIQRAGLDRLNIMKGEKPDEFAIRVLREATLKGDVFLLLGGLLMPADQEGKDWTPKMAAETGEFFASVTEAADKLAVQRVLISAMTGFFVTGLSSLILSRNSSTADETPELERIATGESITTEIGT